MKTTALILLALTVAMTNATAADRVPKEMRPKLLREGKVLVEDKFDGTELDKKWLIPKGDDAGTVTIEQGHAVIAAGAGRQGVIWQKFDAGVTDAGVQLLMKPFACTWMGIRFTATTEPGDRQWKIGVIIYESGFVRVVVPDGLKLKVLKSVRTELKKGDWWRVSLESKGDRYFVRVNGEELIDLKQPETEGPKLGVMVNLYGGKGAIDEVKVTTGI